MQKELSKRSSEDEPWEYSNRQSWVLHARQSGELEDEV